jgi:hypothetical protein
MSTETQMTDQSVHFLNGIPHDVVRGRCALCALEYEMNASADLLNEIIALSRRLKRDTATLGVEQGRLIARAGLPKQKAFLYTMNILIAVMQEAQS